MIKKRVLASILALTISATVLILLSKLTEPKYTKSSREGNLISEYYRALDNGERHDVIFIGDCEAYSSFSPPYLWEKYGITSHVRGSPSQTATQSYHIICETLKYEAPDVIVFSVYALCREVGASEAYNRMTIDGMRQSVYKVRAVRDSISEGESMLSYFLPLIRFHSRWSELSGDDLKYIFSRPSVSHNGYLLRNECVPCDITFTHEDEAPYRLPKENLEYLDKIREVSDEFGVKLLLVKAPTDSWRYPWYDEWSREIEEYSSHYALQYYDLSKKTDEIGIDTERDSYDGGLHLNVYGAEKTTEYFGRILREHIPQKQRDNNNERIWQEKLEEYYSERNKNGNKIDNGNDDSAIACIVPWKRRERTNGKVFF